MPRNREINQAFGVFRTVCCETEFVVGVGLAFPECPHHTNVTTEWKQMPDVDPGESKGNPTGSINEP